MISIIAAIGKNRELGKDNRLLWKIDEDMMRFKNLTGGHTVIMGRKPFESLPLKFRPLPNRVNIVITRDQKYTADGATVVYSIEEAIAEAKRQQDKKIFIIGGAEIYRQGIKYADKLFLTLVEKSYPEADAFFPEYDEFTKVVSDRASSSGELRYRFVELVKDKS